MPTIGRLQVAPSTPRAALQRGMAMPLREHVKAFPDKHSWLLVQAHASLGISHNAPVTVADLDEASKKVRAEIKAKLAAASEDGSVPRATIEEHSVENDQIPVWKHKAACAGAGWAEGKEVTAEEYRAAVDFVDGPNCRFGGYRAR